MEIESLKDAPKGVHHHFWRYFRDAYKVDLALLKKIGNQIRPFTEQPMTYSIDLEGGYSYSGEDLEKLTDSPLIESKKIVSISIKTNYLDHFRCAFKIGNNTLSNHIEVSGYGDPLQYEGLIQQIEGHMKALRPWYWPFYRKIIFSLTVVILYFISLTAAISAFPDVEPNIRSFLVGMAIIGLWFLADSLLFYRVEFLNGLSKRQAERRASFQKFIVVTVILGTVLAIGQEFVKKPFLK